MNVKLRPQSLFVTAPDDVRQSIREGKRPEVRRSVSASSTRPILSRLDTVDAAQAQPSDARASFSTGNFADPVRKKAKLFDVGCPLLTEAHERLIFALREECARLHAYGRHQAGKAAEASAAAAKMQRQLHEHKDAAVLLKESNRRLLAANQALANDLKMATDSLAEVDSMFLSVSKKRMSRLSESAQVLPFEVLEDGHPRERPESPTPTQAYGRSAVSLDVQHR